MTRDFLRNTRSWWLKMTAPVEVKELRRYLAEQCLEDHSVVEPRINVQYVESMISGDSLDEAVLPTQENIEYNDLVSYENQFPFLLWHLPDPG